MNLRAQTPFEPPLPWTAREQPANPEGAHALHLDNASVAGFNALLHELHPDAPHVDAPHLDALAGWLLHLSGDAARGVLDLRLARLQQLRAMLDDADWDADPASRAGLGKLFAYLDDRDDLIPDDTPRLGQLDDVLLAELAWPAFAEEADDYADYCGYRQQAQPAGAPEERRRAWIDDRIAEFAVLRRRMAVRNHRYASVATETALRVRLTRGAARPRCFVPMQRTAASTSL